MFIFFKTNKKSPEVSRGLNAWASNYSWMLVLGFNEYRVSESSQVLDHGCAQGVKCFSIVQATALIIFSAL